MTNQLKMKVTNLSLWLTALFFILLTTQCGEGGDDDPSPNPEPIETSVPTATQLSLDDEGNTGNASDFIIKFIGSSNEANILEYRVLLVKDVQSNTFSLEHALLQTESTYQSVATNGGIQYLNLDAATLDTDGDVLSSTQAYRAFVLSVSIDTEQFTSSLSEASNSMRLSNSGYAIKITYMGAMGIVISNGSQQVIIDGLHENRFGFLPWTSANDQDLDALANASVSWGNSDLLLTSHQHTDHFSARYTNIFLTKNPNALYLAPPLSRVGVSNSSGVESLNLDTGESKQIDHNDIKVKVFSTTHFQAPTQENYSYLVELGGKSILHLGDADITPAAIENIDLTGKVVDVVVIVGNQITDAQRDAIIQNIRPRNVIISHFAANEFTNSALGLFPTAVIFDKAGQFKKY